MARPRKTPLPDAAPSGLGLSSWAEQLGEALGRGVARGINAGLSAGGIGAAISGFGGQAQTGRRRGRPPKVQPGGPVPPDRLCKEDGCGNPARSKGLCSKHYQAERRRQQAKA